MLVDCGVLAVMADVTQASTVPGVAFGGVLRMCRAASRFIELGFGQAFGLFWVLRLFLNLLLFVFH
jgi:hypothetical protein